MRTEFQSENMEEKDNFTDVGLDGRVRFVLKKQTVNVQECIQLVQKDTVRLRAVVDMATNVRLKEKDGNTCWPAERRQASRERGSNPSLWDLLVFAVIVLMTMMSEQGCELQQQI